MSFNPTKCYSLSKHTIKFNQQGVEVILNSTGQKVDGATFSSGFDIKVENGDFCFGQITFGTYFEVAVSLKNPKGGFKFEEGASPKIFGSNEFDDPGIVTHTWEIADCPIRMKEDGTDVIVRCPCTTSGSPCTNKCYSKK